MKLKFALVTAVLLAPGLAAAAGCNYGHEKQAMSCAEGTSYDSTTKTCMPVNT